MSTAGGRLQARPHLWQHASHESVIVETSRLAQDVSSVMETTDGGKPWYTAEASTLSTTSTTRFMLRRILISCVSSLSSSSAVLLLHQERGSSASLSVTRQRCALLHQKIMPVFYCFSRLIWKVSSVLGNSVFLFVDEARAAVFLAHGSPEED